MEVVQGQNWGCSAKGKKILITPQLKSDRMEARGLTLPVETHHMSALHRIVKVIQSCVQYRLNNSSVNKVIERRQED
jgi:hypothetical protein